jgi:hypothetical protein
MGKTNATTSKVTKANKTLAKGTRMKKTVVDGVIGKKTKKNGTMASLDAAKTKKKLLPPKPIPNGWPVSTKPSSRGGGGGGRQHTLSPGNILSKSCNGSDVFLRKRAVQSTSMVFPSSSADYVTNSKRGPTRFLIIFPGRLSLHAPLEATTKKTHDTATLSDNDELPNAESKEEGDNDDGGDEETKKTTEGKKRTPFAPSQPPQLLGKLISRSADGGDHMELRIPFPTHDEACEEGDPPSLTKGEEKIRTLVMSGRAIPLSGKYIALTFKKTGGAKESGGNGRDKKMGTGSIVCKDVFRSVIVLGDTHLLDDGDKTVPLETIATTMRDDDSNAMRHYGGSERTVDGGGGCIDRVKGVRKSLVGSVASMAAVSSIKRKDSVPSKDIDLDKINDASDDLDVGDDDDDSSKADEFVPIVSRKRKSIEEPKKRKSIYESDDDDEVVDIAPAKKRTSRRSVMSANVNYVDESSDSDGDNSDDTDGSSNNEKEDDLPSPTSMPNAKKTQSKKAELKNSITAATKNGNIVKRFDLKDECKPKALPNKSSVKGVTKKDTLAPMKIKNDIIEIDNDDDKVNGNIKFTPIKSHDSESLPAGSSEKLSTPSKSPICHRRRKKNSPLKINNEPAKRKDIIDLNLDDDPDPFTFM